MENRSRGLFVGRFQPFHKGHLEVVKYILSKEKKIIIVIGSAQYSHTLENPFTAGERMEFTWRALDEADVKSDRYYLIPIEDVNIHSIWVSHVVSRVPRFHRVYSNDPLTRQLFEEAGFSVESIPFFNRNNYSATEIRQRILKGGSWEDLVPSQVVKYVKYVRGDHRIKILASTDKLHDKP